MTAAFSSRSAKPDQSPWYRHRWPWLIMAGPAAVVLAGSFSAWLAFTQQDQMVIDNYYDQGLVINQDLQRDARASALALQLRAHYDAASEKMQGMLTRRDTSVAGPTQLRLQLRHATDPKRDRTVLITVDQHGAFSVPLALLERSHWTVLVEDQARSWRLAGVWLWPQQSDIALAADAPAQVAPR